MDRFATVIANLLVGNDANAALLEATFMGPELEFTKDASVAVTAASCRPRSTARSARPGKASP